MIELSATRDGQFVGRVEAEEGRGLRLGRAATNDLVLDGKTVSREHCRISHDGSNWRVEDAGSRAGVFVAGRSVTGSRPLADGDVLEVADFRIAVRITAAGQAMAGPEQTTFRPRPTFVGDGANAVEILDGPGQGTIRRFAAGLLIGRSEKCDLVIDDPTVSREHLRLESRAGSWTAVNRSSGNPVLANGVPFQKTVVASGDILTVGPVRLRLSLDKAAAASAGRSPLIWLRDHKRLAIGAGVGLFALLLLLFFLIPAGKPPREAVIQGEWAKERTMHDAEFMRKVSTLLIQARRLADEGHADQAKARLTALLEIDAGNEEARSLMAGLQAKEEAKAAADREREAKAAQIREAVRPHLDEARRLLATGDTSGAREALGKALALDPALPESQGLLADIETREQAAQREAAAQAAEQARQREQLAALRAEVATATAGEPTYQGLVAARRLAETESDPAQAAKARKLAVEIQDALVKRIMPDFNQGQKFYAQKKYAEAARCWTRVLEIYPEAKETNARMAELTPLIQGEAKRLYEEGLVHEGLGNRETARELWREVLAIAPQPDNEYHRRAAAKLQLAPGKTGAP